MATVTQEVLTCDVCGSANNVQTKAFGFDGKQYEIDLCPKDDKGLSKVAEGCIPNARKITASKDRQPNSPRRHSPRAATAGSEAKANRSQPRKPKTPPKQAAKANSAQQKNGHSQRTPRAAAASGAGTASGAGKASRSQPRKPKTPPKQAANANSAQQKKGVYVYGILPGDIEIADEMPGVGEHPGSLGIVRSDGLAALVSEVDLPERLGSSEDQRIYREILDSTAVEVPVLPLRFGTVLAGEGAVTDELLGPRHDEFAAALEQLEGHVEFVVKGRYVQEAVVGEVLAENSRAAQLRDAIQGKGSDAAKDAKTEFGKILSETITVKRDEDTRALQRVMEGVCAASVVRETGHVLDAVDVAFLVAVDEESTVERVINDLARMWEGRIEVQLLGPMAAYDFVRA